MVTEIFPHKPKLYNDEIILISVAQNVEGFMKSGGWYDDFTISEIGFLLWEIEVGGSHITFRFLCNCKEVNIDNQMNI